MDNGLSIPTITSRFIDEGFGTLDQETLDVAMTTLEKLQHRIKLLETAKLIR